MGLIGQGAVVGINIGDQVVDENLLEGAEVEAGRVRRDPPRPPRGARRAGPAPPGT